MKHVQSQSITRRHIPEVRIHCSHCRENLRSYSPWHLFECSSNARYFLNNTFVKGVNNQNIYIIKSL
jgi:hypothetical protein